MKPLLLCIHMEPAKLMRVSMLALSLGIQAKEVRRRIGGSVWRRCADWKRRKTGRRKPW